MSDPYAFVVEGSVYIAATPEMVFDRICDITRLGELSPECTGGEWLTQDLRVGARFLGHNRSRGRAWTTECEVLVADRPTEFAWHVLTNTTPRTSIWTFRIEAQGPGSRVTETFEMRVTPRPFRAALDTTQLERRGDALETRKRELEEGISATLKALKAELEDCRVRRLQSAHHDVRTVSRGDDLLACGRCRCELLAEELRLRWMQEGFRFVDQE